MKFPLIVCVFLLTVSSSQSVDITARGTERDQVSITCPYPAGYENSYKYFYRGIYAHRVLILESNGKSSVSSGRFSLQDNRQHRSFTVSISDLKMDDAGLYGCRAGWAWVHYLDVQLEVLKEIKTPVKISTTSISPYKHSSTEHPSTVTGVSPSATQTETETRTTTGNTTVQLHQPNTTLPLDLASVAGGLGLVLLVLTLCCGTFIILKKRKRKSGTALFQQNMQRNTETDLMYEEIPNSDVTVVTSSSNQSPASSSNQTPASHHNNCTNVSDVYATVTKRHSDSNPSHTHSANQVTDTAGDYYASIKRPDATQDSGIEMIYTTATNPKNITNATNEGLIYSVINFK